MYLARVLVGECCKGKKCAMVPDSRQGYELYDTTVDNMQDRTMFVTYHDAQAYPGYLIKYTKK